MEKKGHRKNALENEILNLSNEFFKVKMSNPKLKQISVTRVELTSDFAYAKLYWDTFLLDQKNDMAHGLERCQKKLRMDLARNLKLRSVPEIQLVYDSQYESEKKIEDLLKL